MIDSDIIHTDLTDTELNYLLVRGHRGVTVLY